MLNVSDGPVEPPIPAVVPYVSAPVGAVDLEAGRGAAPGVEVGAAGTGLVAHLDPGVSPAAAPVVVHGTERVGRPDSVDDSRWSGEEEGGVGGSQGRGATPVAEAGDDAPPTDKQKDVLDDPVDKRNDVIPGLFAADSIDVDVLSEVENVDGGFVDYVEDDPDDPRQGGEPMATVPFH